MALITFRLITAYYYVVKVKDNRFLSTYIIVKNVNHLQCEVVCLTVYATVAITRVSALPTIFNKLRSISYISSQP